jgi:flagellar biosynthesis protein FlhB
MAEERNDSASRTEEPTQRRLQEARRKGDVAKSPEAPAFLALAATALVLVMAGGAISRDLAARLRPFIERPDSFDLTGGGALKVMNITLLSLLPVSGIMLAAMVAAVAGNIMQTGFIWAPSKLAPDPSKVSPGAGFARIFGPDGLVNFLKSLAKLLAVAAAAWMVLRPRADSLAMLGRLDVAAILPVSAEWLQALAIGALIVFGVIAGADWLWQRQRFMQKMRMSREEVKEDTKETEGDPHLKAKLRQKRLAASKRRIVQAVPTATLVVMNPTHYAVALRYVQGETPAPICVAKGVDALALKIKEIALAHEISVIEDPPLARALYAAMDVDETIPREHFEAVAKIVGAIMGASQRRARPASTPRPARL